MTAALLPGLATSIGSLPHHDPHDAVALVLDCHPQLPAAPQLPRRSPREGMLAQWATGIPGVQVGVDGVLVVADPAALDPEAPVDATIDPAGAAGLFAFLAAAAGRGRGRPVKLQITGPVTLGLALVAAGAAPEVAFPVAGAAVRAKAAALVRLATARLRGAPLVVFVDEPSLTNATHPGFPLDPEDTIDLLSATLAALGPTVVSGVHCCGSGGWRLAIDAGCQVLSAPATPQLLDDAERVAAHLDRGGWVAWGAVPTTGPIGNDAEPLWRRLVDLWRELSRAGCDPVLLRRQALVTPACGLAGHGLSQVDAILRLTTRVGERVRDHGSRASAGA